MNYTCTLDGISRSLDRLLAAAAPILRGESDPLRTLLAAGVIFAGAAEIWYELEAQQEAGDGEQVRLIFRAVSETPLSPDLKAIICFGPNLHPVRLDAQGRAALSVSRQSIQDRSTRRAITPVVLVLTDE